MTKFGDFLLLLLTQFSGGPGPRENNLMRFGLPAILWGVLLLVAWSRQRQQELPREKLLMWGFGLGLARELFMFSHTALNLLEMTGHGAGYFAPEPLEHVLTMLAIVVVAGAFLRYILNNVPLSRRYLRIGVGVTSICYVVTAWWWAGHTITAPECKFNQTWCGFLFHVATSVFVISAIVLLSKKRGWLRNAVSLALTLFLLSEGLKFLNFPTAIPLLGYVYIREQSIEKRETEEALEAHREHLEELVMERTAELALLHEVSVFLTSTLDPVTIYDQMTEQSAKLLGCPVTSIFRWDEERREAVGVSSYGVDDLGGDGLQMLLGESDILSDLITHRQPIVIEDAQTDPRVSLLWREKFNIRALLCLPVWGKEKPLGFLCMIEPREPRHWRPNEVELVESFVNRAAVALVNAHLHKQLEWAAALEERQRIAAEMHDGLAQTLSYTGHRIDHAAELAEAGRVQEVLDECHHIRDAIDQASREVRQSIASLQESPLPRRPLQDWLTEIAGEFTENGGPVATLVTRLTAPLFLPPSHVEQVLRVVQEALLNAGRHAQAQQIIISLERQGDQVTVMVEDDGRGFDVNSPPMDGRDHFGLSIMRARAARIGGQLEIDSSPGQGTRAILTWSLELSSSNNTFQ